MFAEAPPPMPAWRKPHVVEDDYYLKLWHNMKHRCYDSKFCNFKNYGERGITVCKEWLVSYEVFAKALIEEIGPRPSNKYSLDRKNNDGNYEPGNIRWATALQQNKNKRNFVCYDRRGEKNSSAKLKDKQIPKIIAERKAGYKIIDLAEKYSVSSDTISAIVNRKAWRHIT